MTRLRLLPPLALLAFSSSVGITFFASAPQAQATAAVTSTTSTTAPPATGAPTTTKTTKTKTTTSTTSTTATSTSTTSSTTSGAVLPTTPTTVALAPYSQEDGETLFDANCASCHGVNAAGSSRAPNLVGLGPATVDFWLSTGRMPLATPSAEAEPKQPRFSIPEQMDIVKYVSSLGPGGLGIPVVDVNSGNLSNGFSLYVTNCAGCHAVSGVGDALSNGLSAPSLYYATPTQIAEAIETGPANMPRFSAYQFSAAQLNDVVAYVAKGIQHPDDKGGNGLGHVGPITEGLVALFLGLGSMLGILYWIGDRA